MKYFFLILFWISSLQAQELRVPELRDPVMDEVGLLSPEVTTGLSRILSTLSSQKGTQIAVFITQDLQGRSLEDFAIKVVEKWKLGTEKDDRGALLLIVRGERKIRIEVGRGLEGELTDLVSRDIIDREMTTRFRSGEFDLGVLQAVLKMIRVAEPDFPLDTVLDEDRNLDQRSRGGSAVALVILLLFLYKFLMFGFVALGPPELVALVLGASRSSGWGRGGFRGGGGFGGGGGWSGGGGSFGGGGASGGW